jgi:hypothetical protein
MNPDTYNYLSELSRKNFHPITFSGNTPVILNRWLVKCEYRIPENPLCPEPILSLNSKIIVQEDFNNLPKEEIDTSWRFYISSNQEDFYSSNYVEPVFSSRKDKTIYCLNSIYCEKDEDLVFNINNATPISIWINGQLAIKNHFNYHVRPNYIFIRLRKGIHFVLVERIALRTNAIIHQYFHLFYISVKPFNFLFKGFGFLDKKMLIHYEKSLVIVPDHVVYNQEKKIQLIVLSNRIIPGRKQKINLSLFDYSGQMVFSREALTQELIILEPLTRLEGVYRITAQTNELQSSGATYIFKGDIDQKTTELITKAETLKNSNSDIIYNFQCLSRILDYQNGFFKNNCEIAFKTFYDFILEKYTDFERHLSNDSNTRDTALQDIFKNSFMYFQKSTIDDDYAIGWVQLPADYEPGKKMALVINYSYGAAGSRYPNITAYSEARLFKNAVILNFCGRGALNRDFINELEIIKIINFVFKNFNIDRDRISALGYCTGGLNAFNWAFHFPDLFSALASICSTPRMELNHPDYSYSGNINNVTLYSIANIEDCALNGARVIDTASHFKKLKSISYAQFIHMEFEESFHSSKLLESVIKEKRNPYPISVELKTSEPHCNKAYWVQIKRIQNLCFPAFVKAKVINSERVQLETDNIECLNLLINRKSMKLNKTVFIAWRDITKKIVLSDYNITSLFFKGNSIKTETRPISSDDFEYSYNKLELDCSLLGIKEVYTGSCHIIKPCITDEDTDFSSKFLYYLQSPLKEKIRNYKFPVIEKIDPSGQLPANSHFIYYFDTGKTNKADVPFLRNFNFKFTQEFLELNNNRFTGETFLFFKNRHPYNPGKKGLAIAYNCNKVKNELFKFFDGFDTNPLFYHDIVVFNNGKYTGFRN